MKKKKLCELMVRNTKEHTQIVANKILTPGMGGLITFYAADEIEKMLELVKYGVVSYEGEIPTQLKEKLTAVSLSGMVTPMSPEALKTPLETIEKEETQTLAEQVEVVTEVATTSPLAHECSPISVEEINDMDRKQMFELAGKHEVTLGGRVTTDKMRQMLLEHFGHPAEVVAE